MNWPDILLVTLAVLASSLYLLRCFWPTGRDKSRSCGCGSVDCKLPKPKLK